MTEPIPLSLYVHLPWCIRKCPYCDFNSHTAPASLPEQEYIDALLRDFDSHLETIWGRRLTSIFIGGGTPSLFSADSIKTLLQQIHARLPFHPDMEITLEANPGTVEQQRFDGFRAAGINRLSLGVQSFNPGHLKKLGRIHDHHDALRAIDIAKRAGFENINIDIMFGLNQQTLAEALSDIQQAINLNTSHLSWYELTIEPNTVFYKTKPPLPSDELKIAMQTQGQQLLKNHGFEQYEVSAYAKPDQYCRHNLNYWEFGDYLGLGAGAHSKLTNLAEQTIIRHHNVKQPKDYLNKEKSFIAEKSAINEDELVFEFMLNALRLKNGVPLALFTERTGLPLSDISDKLETLTHDGLLEKSDLLLKTTELGYLHLNAVLLRFM